MTDLNNIGKVYPDVLFEVTRSAHCETYRIATRIKRKATNKKYYYQDVVEIYNHASHIPYLFLTKNLSTLVSRFTYNCDIVLKAKPLTKKQLEISLGGFKLFEEVKI